MHGCSLRLGCVKIRFISLPLKSVRELPIMTPSGLVIGIILNINLFRSLQASMCLLHTNRKNPSIVQDPTVSLGWTRPVTTMYFFKDTGMSGFVTVKIGTSIRDKLLHKTDLVTCDI